MATVGPQLPPHLQAKRKREDEDNRMEPQSRSPSIDSNSKKARIVGPAPPASASDEQNVETVDTSNNESSSEDEYGPALPGKFEELKSTKSLFDDKVVESRLPLENTKRDEWMTMAPKQDDLSARMDPTKIRARKFNTGKGARGPKQASEGSSVWMETPEQKRKRLEDEVLGRTNEASTEPMNARERKAHKEDEVKAAKIREHDAIHRSKSLYSQHQNSWQKEKDDDPSKRTFDYEKDVGGGKKIGRGEKKDMLARASNFESRFAGGSYL